MFITLFDFTGVFFCKDFQNDNVEFFCIHVGVLVDVFMSLYMAVVYICLFDRLTHWNGGKHLHNGVLSVD